MKIEMTKTRSLLLMAVMLLAGTAFSHGTEPESVKKKVISKSFDVSEGDVLTTSNRYGNTTVTYWDIREVSVRVEIEVKSRNDATSQAMIDRVQIELKKDGNTVSATTSLSENVHFQNFKGNFSINYYINMPPKMDMNLAQKYGNISLPEKNEGKCSLDVKYGNLKAGSFTRPLDVKVKYGDMNIDDAEEAVLDLGYCGTASIGNTQRLEIDSKYSDLKIGRCGELSLENKYGDINIKSLTKGEMDIKYGDTTIGSVEEALSVGELAYSDLLIWKLASDFKTLDVDARYGNLSVGIEPKTEFEVIAENMKYGKVEVDGFNITRTVKEDKTDHRYEINGGGKKTIRFDGNNYSNIRVKAL